MLDFHFLLFILRVNDISIIIFVFGKQAEINKSIKQLELEGKEEKNNVKFITAVLCTSIAN